MLYTCIPYAYGLDVSPSPSLVLTRVHTYPISAYMLLDRLTTLILPPLCISYFPRLPRTLFCLLSLLICTLCSASDSPLPHLLPIPYPPHDPWRIFSASPSFTVFLSHHQRHSKSFSLVSLYAVLVSLAIFRRFLFFFSLFCVFIYPSLAFPHVFHSIHSTYAAAPPSSSLALACHHSRTLSILRRHFSFSFLYTYPH